MFLGKWTWKGEFQSVDDQLKYTKWSNVSVAEVRSVRCKDLHGIDSGRYKISPAIESPTHVCSGIVSMPRPPNWELPDGYAQIDPKQPIIYVNIFINCYTSNFMN